MVTALDLNKFLGKNIDAICGNDYVDPHDNHCAHFVSHALGYDFGYPCRTTGTLPREFPSRFSDSPLIVFLDL
jgi:hypothetical protein